MKESEHILYGAQYYRAPTPFRSDWESDIRKMKECGFNTIKIWAQWGSNCKKEGVYDFSDLETIMDIAYDNGIGVIVNVILDVAPAWFCVKYPDSVMLTADGRRIEYRPLAYRQIGGAPGPCFHHPEGMKAAHSFVDALAAKLSNHPALCVWDMWNEPELGSGIEKREPTEDDLLCYCEHSKKAFREWLKEKYGSVETLNGAWNRCYESFDEILPPHSGSTFSDMIDWRAFFADTIVNETQIRADIIRRYDKQHPVMVHTVPLPYFNMVAACSDDYRLAQIGDMHGNSLGTNPFSATISVSAAEEKPVISSEMHITGGTTYGRPCIPEWKVFKQSVLIPLSKGVKGFQYWQYRPERLGTESPAWGLTKPDGTRTAALDYAEKIARALSEYESVLLPAKPEKSKIAIINASDSQVFDWCAGGSCEKYYRSLKGLFDAFHAKNLNADIVSAEQLTKQKLKQYRMVVYPFPHYVGTALAARLKEWVSDGGMLVSECFFGAVSSDGLFQKTVPGLGFDEVFGVDETEVFTATVFHDAYSESWSTEDKKNNILSLRMKRKLGGLDENDAVEGYYFSEGFRAHEDAEVLAEFSDGRSAMVYHPYQKGSAVLMGSLCGYCYDLLKTDGLPMLLSALAERAGVSPAAVCSHDDVRVDVLGDGNRTMVVMIFNNSSATVKDAVEIEGLSGTFEEIFTKQKFTAQDGHLFFEAESGDCLTLCRMDG